MQARFSRLWGNTRPSTSRCTITGPAHPTPSDRPNCDVSSDCANTMDGTARRGGSYLSRRVSHLFAHHTVPNYPALFSWSNTQAFDEFPTWKSLMFVEIETRKRGLAGPGNRGKSCAPISPSHDRRHFIGGGILYESKR